MAEVGDLRIDGNIYDPNTLTYREGREMRRILREELFAGEEVDESTLSQADTLPAMIVVLVRRDKPEYTLDEALDLAHHDVVLTKEDIAALAPPTKRTGARRKSPTSGASGSGSAK